MPGTEAARRKLEAVVRVRPGVVRLLTVTVDHLQAILTLVWILTTAEIRMVNQRYGVTQRTRTHAMNSAIPSEMVGTSFFNIVPMQ